MIEVSEAFFDGVYRVSPVPWVLLVAALLSFGILVGIVVFGQMKRKRILALGVGFIATTLLVIPISSWAAYENEKMNKSLSEAWSEVAQEIAVASDLDELVFDEPIPVRGAVTAFGSPFTSRIHEVSVRATTVSAEGRKPVWVVMKRTDEPGLRFLAEVRPVLNGAPTN